MITKKKAVNDVCVISDRIRAYVNDPTVSDHYGAWGILRFDQRKQIRELCDLCDMYEKTADLLTAELARAKSQINRLKKYDEERDIALHARLVAEAKSEVAREIFEEIENVACIYKLDGDFYIDNGFYAELKKKYTEESQ